MDKQWEATLHNISSCVPTDYELVQQHPFYIANIKNPSPELQLAAVKQNPEVLGIITNPDRSVIQYALVSNGFTIRYVKDPDEELQLLAIDVTSAPVMYIQDPTKIVIDQALRDDDFIISSQNAYKNFVARIFKDNSILINKWIRYCDNVRDLSTNETR